MENTKNNPKCELSNTHYCALMNLQSCDVCPAMNGTPINQIKEDLDVYEELLPEGGVAQLFLSNRCQLCVKQPGQPRKGYTFLYMGHPEPKRLQKKLFFIKRMPSFGTMIPIQLSTCEDCRKRIMFTNYLPMITPVVFGLIGLILMMVESIREALAGVILWLPLVSWLALIGIGVVLGRVFAKAYGNAKSAETYVNVLEQPVLKQMVKKGWEPVGKKGRPDVVFSKSRRVRGLGTAIPEEKEIN